MMTLAADKAAQEIIRVGKAAYHRNLVSGRAGNLSARLSGSRFMITGQGAPLGFLSKNDLVVADSNGDKKRGQRNLSFETGLHAALYKTMRPGAVVHVHAPSTLTLIESAQNIKPLTFEAEIFLGNVPVVPQQAPNVTDNEAVTAALALNNIVILKNHGVVSIGETIWDAFFLAELLEETAQMNIFWRFLGKNISPNKKASPSVLKCKKPVRLFSKDHFSLLQQVINRDRALHKMSIKTSVAIGIKQADTGRVHIFAFNNGKLAGIKTEYEKCTFLITGTTAAWSAIVNGLMDPFTAIIQKKVLLEGNFRDLLQQYPFFRQLFNLWQTVPVRECLK